MIRFDQRSKNGFSFVSWSQAQANGVRVQTVTPRSIRLDRD